MDFKNQVCWITGASSGIGKAVAELLLSKGARCILSARNEESLQAIKNGQEESERAFVLPLDLSDYQSLESKSKQAIEAFGKLDILILSGGISQRSFTQETSMDVYRELMEVNYFSSVALTKYVLTHMLERGSGHIVPVSSLLGKFGTPFRSGYSGSKHALHGFFDSLRSEVYEDGIRVNIITPGFVKTNISVNALKGDGAKSNKMDEGQEKAMSAEQCAKRLLKAIARNKEEVLIGGKEIAGVYIKRFWPALFSKLIRRSKVR